MFYLFHVFRSFIPLSNPIGFGASDFVEFFVAAVLVVLVLARDHLVRFAKSFAEKTVWCMLGLGALTILLRLALLPQAGVPIASSADDASYLLLADTLSHFRLANPTHLFHRFFEANFVLQEPSYSSIFPMGQGIALELGRAIFGHPWAGVLLSEAALCALCYWMLRGWISAGWALAGGVLAVFQLGPLTYWMNSYWGGAVSGIAGCLAFGAMGRLLKRDCQEAVSRNAILMGVGLGLELLTRPYECVFLTAVVAGFLLFHWKRLATAAPLVVAATLPFLSLTLAQNRAVTGSWTTLPYMASRYQYGVPTTFTFQPVPVLHRELTPQQQRGYDVQSEVHDRESAQSLWERLFDRAEYVRFFLCPALLLTLPIFLFALRRDRRLWWPAAAIFLIFAGSAFYPYFYPHYYAAVACALLLVALVGLQRIPRLASCTILFLAAAHFAFWFGVHAYGNQDFLDAFGPFELFDFVNHGDPEGRRPILKQLEESAGGQLVFVRYAPFHPLREWITNAADIDRSKVVWALDLGPEEDSKLRDYYPDRTAWLAEPDARPPRLLPYPQ
ncbi:MAG TPA: hypothetical protein VGG72_30180 [Bryobacteraceae bacterium]|jgi:hypothetical protein